MGKLASEYWEKAEQSERLSKEVAKSWLKEPCWSIGDACELMAGFEPDDRFNSQVSGHSQKQIFEILRCLVVDETPRRNANKVFSFYGRRTKIRGVFEAHFDLLRLEFPVWTYFAFAMRELFPNAKLGYDLPVFGFFHDLDRENENDVVEKIEDDFSVFLGKLLDEIAANLSALGLTSLPDYAVPRATKPQESEVKSVLALVSDKENPRYRAELHAALSVWESFESKPVPDGLTTMQEIKLRLADWEVEHDYELLESERKRVRVMVNWDKDGNKQKPKKR